MSAKNLIHVKGDKIPPDLLAQMKANIEMTFTIIPEIDYDVDGKPMPPEEAFKPEFVEEVEKSCKEYREGKRAGTLCKTEEERKEFFDEVFGINNG